MKSANHEQAETNPTSYEVIKATSINRTSVEDLTNLRSWNQIVDKCMCVMYVMMYVCVTSFPILPSRRRLFPKVRM